MPIKFTCPHCKKAMTAPDSLAGKKARCKACQQVLTVPKPANAKPSAPGSSTAAPSPPASPVKAAPPAPRSAPPPLSPPPADVEAEAAALFGDEPKTEEPVEVKTIELNCPFCDEKIQFSADLAGKRAPCPECKHIIKVPELIKKEPKDWRKSDPRGPAGARLPDQPALEGAWGSATAGKVGQETLKKVGVIPTVKPPRTFWQKVRWPAVGVGAVILLTGLSWGGYRWWSRQTVERLLGDAVAYAAAPESKQTVGETGQAELLIGAGQFELNRKTPGCVEKAFQHAGKASTLLQSAPASSEKDAVLAGLMLAFIEMAGGPPQTDQGLRQPWNKIHPLLTKTLGQVSKPEALRAALRTVSRRLIQIGEAQRALTLVGQIYTKPDEDKAAALSIVALELHRANDKDRAARTAEEALKLYDSKEPPPVSAEVVAAGLLLRDKPPRLPDDAKEEQKANEQVGRAEALARQEQWDDARKKAESPNATTRFRALLAIAAAAVDAKSDAAANDVEAAANAIEKVESRSELSWSLLRLTELALRAGLPEERVQSLADTIPDRPLRARAHLAIFRDRLARAQQPVEESAADRIDPGMLARALAVEDLARHNTKLDRGWTKNVQGWDQPRKAFGSLGAALGMQDGSGK